MKCPECQFENREGIKFREKCGVKLQLICPECATKLPPDRLFCGECGQELREPKESLPLDCFQLQSYISKHLKDKILISRNSIEGEWKMVTVFLGNIANLY